MAKKALSVKKVSRAINMAFGESLEAIRNTREIAGLCDRIANERTAENLSHVKKRLRENLHLDEEDIEDEDE